MPRPAVLALCLFLALPAAALAQARPHVIQGRVTSDSGGKPVAAADVIVTVAPSAETITGKTDAAGDYRVVIANPTGEYILNISMIGFRPFRQRVTIARGDSAATVNAHLAPNVAQLAGVRVQATRPRPQRTAGVDNGFGGDPSSKTFDGVTNALPPELQGNFDAMAALTPGYTGLAGGGFSAFGLGADANMKTVNGMSFSGDALPRDLSTTTRFIASPWDPTRGGFSGALASTTINRGSNILQNRARVTLDAPSLQAADPTAESFGQKYTNLQLGGSRSGALSLDRYFYNAGYSASLMRAPVSSLLDIDPDALLHAGISPDSAARLTQILNLAGVPLTRGGIPDQRTTFSGNFAERIDFARPNPPPGQTPLPQWNVVMLGNYNETRAPNLAPTALPATTGKVQNGGAQVQGLYSRYFGKFGDYVSETMAGVSFNEQKGTPYLALPSGNVLIASSLAGGGPTLGSLNFGGNSAFARDNRVAALEANNTTTFLLRDHPSLPTTLYFQSRYEHFDQSLSANRLGSFSYASLADLAANQPSAFTRTLNTPARAGGEWIGAAAIGSNYVTQPFVLTGGLRVDADAFTGLPAFNPAIENTFGIRNDQAPNSVALSPRVGFTWYYKTHAPQNLLNISPWSLIGRGGPAIRGGVGEFRNFLRSNLLSDAIGTTGLPGSTERLICTGPAAPIPDWQAYLSDPSAVPSTCAGGSPVFADTAATAVIVDPSYQPMRSWRGTLGWTNTILGNYLAIDGTYSLNLNQPGTVDLNFAGKPQFTLPDEGNRPVFVSAGSVVPSTGVASAVESRRSAAFSQVADRVSDLRGDTRQIVAYVIPNIPFRWGLVTLGYTWSDARSQARGFDQSTATDPRAIEWATVATQPRHQVIVQAARPLYRFLFISTSMKFSSGLRYAPVVAGDVNGDGWLNDRAFIFNPAAATSDTAVSRGLRNLMATGSRSARDCLSSQIGTLAGRNSCVGPWSATMNASIFAANIPKTDNRLNVTLNLANPLGGLDQLLHGSDHLHGWGMTPFPDGTLYQVRGFDPVAQRYFYQVNPRFGNTNPAFTTLRTPFRMTLDVRWDYGPNRQEQAVILNVRVKPPLAGTRASADTIRRRYVCGNAQGANGYSDIYRFLLRLSDSLALSRDQVERMQARQTLMHAKADSVYGGLANYLAAMPADFSPKDASTHVSDTELAVWKLIYAESAFLKELLTPGQIRLLPTPIYNMVTNPSPNFNARFFLGPAC
ncbi:MAG TPA: carboxypeptidase-like regulatory domain-containing protein [Gemmatimonadaceae bacterium]|nr:carboxypeptidase-like regulatory domain-containing protein [Gemmatimonadaceae bacterium]